MHIITSFMDGVQNGQRGKKEETAAERLAERIRTADLSDPILKKLELASVEFLQAKGFDIKGHRKSLLTGED